jgi:hypothetical protein
MSEKFAAMDSAFFESAPKPVVQDSDTFDLFAPVVEVRTPDIRTEAPSAPGSETSKVAALDVSSPFRRASWRKLMLVLGSVTEPLSMHELSVRCDIPINVVCPRLSELQPLWVERHDAACESHAKQNLRVNGYRLTPAGRARLVEAAA